jgi:arginine N-succinyltransferase
MMRATLRAQAGGAVALHVHDLRSGAELASAQLCAAIGMDLPRYAYHVGCVVHASRELRLFQRQRTLFLSNDHTGASELHGVVWTHDAMLAEVESALSLLVQTALLWVAQHRADFADRVIVALPGVRDGSGQSPFWAGLGQAFIDADPALVAREHGESWKSHLASLLPRHPLYASFLPDTAQAAIAQPSKGLEPLVEVLEHEGWRYGHHVDLYDGGPILEARMDDLPVVRASRAGSLRLEHSIGTAPASVHSVLRLDANECLHLTGHWSGDQFLVSRERVAGLNIETGTRIRAVPLLPSAA